MAIHLTPTELARESGMERREVIEKCMEPVSYTHLTLPTTPYV